MSIETLWSRVSRNLWENSADACFPFGEIENVNIVRQTQVAAADDIFAAPQLSHQLNQLRFSSTHVPHILDETAQVNPTEFYI